MRFFAAFFWLAAASLCQAQAVPDCWFSWGYEPEPPCAACASLHSCPTLVDYDNLCGFWVDQVCGKDRKFILTNSGFVGRKLSEVYRQCVSTYSCVPSYDPVTGCYFCLRGPQLAVPSAEFLDHDLAEYCDQTLLEGEL